MKNMTASKGKARKKPFAPAKKPARAKSKMPCMKHKKMRMEMAEGSMPSWMI